MNTLYPSKETLTLEQVRDWHRDQARSCGWFQLAQKEGALHDELVDAIQREIDAKKGAISVSDVQLDFSVNFMDGWLHDEREEVLRNWNNVKHVALQASIGGRND